MQQIHAEEKIKYRTSSNEKINNFVFSLNGNIQKRNIEDFLNKVIQQSDKHVNTVAAGLSIDTVFNAATGAYVKTEIAGNNKNLRENLIVPLKLLLV